MKKIIHFLIRQKLLVNLLVFLIMAIGLYVMENTNREAYPEVNFDMVSIKTIYPGGSPDDIEKLISTPLEKKLKGLDNIDKVRSYNIENVSVVVVYIEDKASNKKEVVQDIKDAIEQIDNLPEKAEIPIVEEIDLEKTPAIDIALYGSKKGVPYHIIRDTADNLEDFLYEIEGVAEVESFGYYDREYLVEVSPEALTRYHIGMNDVINTIQSRNIDLPGGSLKIEDKEYILRTKGQFENIDEILNTVIIANDAGFVTKIKDVAKVYDTFEEADVYERFNGHKAVIFTVWKKRSADEINLVNNLKEQIKRFTYDTDNISVQFFNDTSEFTRTRLASVIQNGIVGFILLFSILIFLLGFRMAAIVSFSIPIAFMTAFFGMLMGNITLNVVSMFGMIMVLGMIVDFGIVVSENSHRYMEKGWKKFESIEKGVTEVFWPVTVTLLCISAAFTPLLFLTGLIGKFIVGIPIVLLMCLTASWFIAMFIMPTHMNMFALANGDKKYHEKVNSKSEKGFFAKIQRKYKTFLNMALKHRYLTLAILIILFAGSLFLIQFVGFVFMPGGGAEELEIKVKFPRETNLEANLREIKKIEKIITLLPKDELEALRCKIGEDATDLIDPKPGEGTHKSTLALYLTPHKDRKKDAQQILAQVRQDILKAKTEKILFAKMNFEFSVKQHGPPIGKPVNVEIRGKDFEILKNISFEYINYLKTIEGVSDITMDLEEGKQEYRYLIDEVMSARSNVSVKDVANALNASFEGAVASSVNKGEEDIDIRVRFPETSRKSIQSLNEVIIANKRGGLIPLDKVTKMVKQPGYTQINRLNYKRVVQVQAEVDIDTITSIEVNRLLAKKFADIEKRYVGYSISYGGEQEDTNKSMRELGVLFIFALFVIYIILAVFLNSLILPVVVMIAIPFALVGVVFTLLVHGAPLSFMGCLGIFSLAGVIVSNTLVLVQFINYMRDEGLNSKEALIEAGVIRLRPVLLTSGTTVLGLFPTIYGLLGGIDYFVSPLALAFGYGLIFATFITLVLIPCFYLIAEDLKSFTAKLLSFLGLDIEKTIYQAKPGREKIS